MDISDPRRLFDDVLARAVPEIRAGGIDVFTFAFYHDHESSAVSICVDTEVNSAHLVRSQNTFRSKQFADAVGRGDLQKASLFNANVGRNLSLGDFAMINVARSSIGPVVVGAAFYLEMIRAVCARERDVASLASNAQRLLFCSSSAKWEVGYTWTVA